MEVDTILYIVYSNTAIIISLVLALMFWLRRSAPGARYMFYMMLFAALWGLSDFLSDISSVNADKIFWENVSYIGIVIIPVMWLIFTLQYTKLERYLTRRNLALLSLIPLITLVMVGTNDLHHFMATEIGFRKAGELNILTPSFGWWFWIHAVYSYSLLLLGMIILIRKLITMPRIFRIQTGIVLAAIVIPFLGNVLYTFKVSPSYPIDPTTFSFTFTGIVCFWGMFRYKLFDMIPTARNAVIDDMSAVLIVLDNRNHIIDMNLAAKRIFGGFEEDLTGKPIMEVIGEWSAYFGRYGHVQTAEEKISLDTEDGKLWFDLKITPIFDNKARSIGRSIILYDITKLETAIHDLEISRKAAEDASKAKSRFLATMSHEIRTPLNGIVGMAELLASSDSAEEQKAYLQVLQSCSDSLLGVINEILDFSKIEAGKMELDRSSFSLSSLMDITVRAFVHQTAGKDLKLTCDISPGIPEKLAGDPGKLRQILVNLIGNAVKFTEQGEIEVKAELAKDEGRQVVVLFSVRDTGTGIPEDQISSLFQSFHQIDGSFTRKYGGTGLGLVIVKSLVEMMGGNVNVESKPGEGSRFYFSIPFEIPENEEVRVLPGAGIEFPDREISILLAEDNMANRMLMVKLLEKKNLKADIAENGKMVLDKLKEKAFDLILMDIQMPEMDGYETTGTIRKNEEDTGRHIPIIALTANATEEDRDRCMSTGMDDYLAKPVKPQRLYECLKRHIS